jgi:hypothetical protein
VGVMGVMLVLKLARTGQQYRTSVLRRATSSVSARRLAGRGTSCHSRDDLPCAVIVLQKLLVRWSGLPSTVQRIATEHTSASKALHGN